LEWAEQSIAAYTIRAPTTGLVLIGEQSEGRKYQVGDEVRMGETIVRMPPAGASMRVRAFLSDVDDGRVAAGQEAYVTLDAYPERTFKGKVREISPVALEVSEKSPRRVFRVAVDLEDAEETTLSPGLSARIEVVVARVSDTVLVPRAALDFSILPYKARVKGGASLPVGLAGCNSAVCVAESGMVPGQLLERFTP
jgi:multidrug efflux pump subunit AcrA (membrane-fusion protein)